MKRFIQKTTSIFMSLAMVALIGAPAYASTAEDETLQPEVQTTESVLPDTEHSYVNEETEESAFEEELDVEEIVLDIPTENTEESEQAEEEPKKTETSEISADAVLDYLGSEEVRDALEDAGVSVEELEEDIENGDMEIVEVTEDDLPEEIKNLNVSELYGASVLTVFEEGRQLLVEGLFLIAIAPFGIILWAFPPIGAAYTIAGIPVALLFTLSGAAMIIASPIAGAFMAAEMKSN